MIIKTEFAHMPGEIYETEYGKVVYSKDEYKRAYDEYANIFQQYKNSIFYYRSLDIIKEGYNFANHIGIIMYNIGKYVTIKIDNENESECCKKINKMIKAGAEYEVVKVLTSTLEEPDKRGVRHVKPGSLCIYGFELRPVDRKIAGWRVIE